MNSKWIQSTDFTRVVSPITGNEILRNDNENMFLVPEDLSLAVVRKVCNRVIMGWTMAEEWYRLTGTPYETAIMALVAIRSRKAFVAGFDGLIDAIISGEKNHPTLITKMGLRARFLGLAAALWSARMLALPIRLPFTARGQLDLSLPDIQKYSPWVLEVVKASNSDKPSYRRRSAFKAWRLAMTGLGIKEIGDVVPDAVQSFAIYGEGERGQIVMAVRPILAIQKKIYGRLAVFTEHDWGVGRGKYCPPVRFDEIEAANPELISWVQIVKTWFDHPATGSVVHKADTIKTFLRYLGDCPSVTRDPVVFVSRTYQCSPRFEEWIDGRELDPHTAAKRISMVANLFDWYVDVKLAQEDDFGRPIRSPLFLNPVTKRREPARRAETAREALPVKYIRELIYIIMHNDFEWPKQFKEDYMMRVNPKTNEWERVWSPVRAYAMLVKLYLPLRTYQVCMLESGEADSEVFCNGRWMKNDSALKPHGRQVRRRGFLRKFIDKSTKAEFTGFYVNTNKTADRFKDNDDKGYEIPWQHDEVIGIAQRMAEWQATYNPLHHLTQWSSITHPVVTRAFTPAQLKARGESAFLFRDPAKAHKDQPVYVGRLAHFWQKLLDELERRVAERGEALPNGQPIRFIEKRTKSGVPMVAVFDLHTLRVSILTALAVDGGVPLEILSKCVAGHATTLMTIYYIKQGPAYISQQLAEAQVKMLEREQDNYLRFLQDCDLKDAEAVVAFNDQVGLSAAKRNTPAGWVVSDIGLCPVGGARCHEGGPRLSTDVTRNIFTPTPGGPRNCVRCRFFLTGPAFLGGLVANFNATGMEVIDAAERLQVMQKDIAKLEDDVFRQNLGAQSETYLALNTLYSRLESAMANVDEVANTWHATFSLIERSKAILAGATGEGQDSDVKLVATTSLADLRITVANATRFDLYDSICQHAMVFPATNVPAANLRRGRMLDAMLARNMRQPVFASLSDQEALAVGNQMVALLMARLGHHETHRLLEGTRLLKASGVADELDALLTSNPETPIKFQSVGGGRPALPATTVEEGLA